MNPKMDSEKESTETPGDAVTSKGRRFLDVGQSAEVLSDGVGDIRLAILETLTYYDCFEFPLTFEELLTLVGVRVERPRLLLSLEELVNAGWLTKAVGGDQAFYALCWERLEGEPGGNQRGVVRKRKATAQEGVDRRVVGQSGAELIWPRVADRCRLIDRFPFVRGVAVSGSLSKGVHFAGDDVDFFLVTAPGRVWTCRLLLMLFKRLALFGARDLFCINYLVDETALGVPDRNLFTAAEITWLLPVVGQEKLGDFFHANQWVEDFIPRWSRGFVGRPSRPQRERDIKGEPWWLKRSMQWLLSGRVGGAVERASRRLIKRRNARRYGHSLTKEEFAQAMRAEDTVSKHHPSNQQGQILGRFGQRFSRVKTAWQMELAGEGGEIASKRF